MRRWLLALALLAPASLARAQAPADTALDRDPWLWPGASPTPDVTLQIFPVGQDSAGGHARVRYKALGLGFPAGQELVAWGFRLGASRALCLQSGFVVDSTGRVSCAGARAPGDSCAPCTLPLDQIVLTATGYAAGEPYRLGVISPDGRVRAYAQAFPVPVESASDSLRIHLEMVRPDGLEYAVMGEGFRPGSTVGVTTRSGERSGSQKMIVPPSGSFRIEVLPQVAGEPAGFASVTIESAHRRMTLDWPWGRAAIKDH
jgi:hypothetical protein